MDPKPADELDVGDDIVDILFGADEPKKKQEEPQTPQDDQTAGASALLAEIQQLRDEIAKQAQDTNTASDPEDDGVKIDIPKVDDEQLGRLAKHKDKLEAIAKSATGEELQAVAGHLTELKKQLKELQEGMQKQAEATFAQQLRIAIPDIDTLHQSDDFKAYLKEIAPLSGGRTIGSLLQDAYGSGDLGRVQEIVGAYRERANKTSTPAGDVRPPVSGVAAPQLGATQNAAGDDLEARYVKASQKLLDMYGQKKLDDAAYQEKVQKLRQRYEAKVAGSEEALAL